MNAPCVNFPKPNHIPDQVWRNWLRLVRNGDAQPNRMSLGAYAGRYEKRQPPPKPEPPRLTLCRRLTPAWMGRQAFREMCARIEAGKCDPRFVVGLDGIMWDATRLAPTGAGD